MSRWMDGGMEGGKKNGCNVQNPTGTTFSCPTEVLSDPSVICPGS